MRAANLSGSRPSSTLGTPSELPWCHRKLKPGAKPGHAADVNLAAEAHSQVLHAVVVDQLFSSAQYGWRVSGQHRLTAHPLTGMETGGVQDVSTRTAPRTDERYSKVYLLGGGCGDGGCLSLAS